jgi:iron complex outermembrane recepter protein
MSRISSRLNGTVACLALFAGAFLAGPAAAQQIAANIAPNTSGAGEIETVVVTGTEFNPDVAPAKASLQTMEPQTIINRSYIEDSVADTADYTTILGVAPSMTGFSTNGPGLSDGDVKNTMRGLPDGSYGMTYDGIPFGDTNGPSHHSESYFPGPTIGSIDVDRGPGNAGNLGAATFGGSVNMLSEVLTPDSSVRTTFTYGSWNTTNFDVRWQSGDLGNTNTRALINLQDISSDGYLTYQNTAHQNALIKIQNQFAPNWTVTVFANYNGLFQHLNDNNGVTPAQIVTFGKNYALQKTNSALGNYSEFNQIQKKTDIEYLRLQGDLGALAIDDTAYTYAYVNKTMTATSPEQTAAEIAAGVTDGNGTTVNGQKFPNDVPGYSKLNAYRVWGNILRSSHDFDFGWLTGQLRAGVWWEGQSTERARFDFDMTKCLQLGCNVWHADPALVGDSTLAAKKKAVALPQGYAEYLEHTGWNQYEPFIELELHPLDGLTVTPGFKYVWWEHTSNAVVEPKSSPLGPRTGKFTTTRDLPFLMANYKLQPSWSLYAQYAQGIYVPDVKAFEQKVAVTTYPAAETTSNYQFGSVYYADQFTIDADFYYIGVNNNYVFQDCALAPIFGTKGENCAVNTGTAVYRGLEGEGTYAFSGQMDGLALFMNGSVGTAKSSGRWLKNAPMWTAAGGLVYKRDTFKLSLVDKIVGQQYSDNADTLFYKLGAYNNMDFKGSFSLGNLEFGLGIYNLFNSRALANIGINDSAQGAGSSARDYGARGDSLDQYYFQPARSYQISMKARF